MEQDDRFNLYLNDSGGLNNGISPDSRSREGIQEKPDYIDYSDSYDKASSKSEDMNVRKEGSHMKDENAVQIPESDVTVLERPKGPAGPTQAGPGGVAVNAGDVKATVGVDKVDNSKTYTAGDNATINIDESKHKSISRFDKTPPAPSEAKSGLDMEMGR